MRHKTALVSALSIVGVLMAGASALGANMGILDGNDAIGELTAVSNTVASATSSSTGLSTTTSSTELAPELTAYQINGVGVVTVARDGKQLTVDTVDVGAWAYTVEKQGKELVMSFRLDDRTVNLTATVKNGQVLLEVWEDDVIIQSGGGSTGGTTPAVDPGTTSTSTASATTSTTGSYYEDDDEYDDDGYEDDDYEDDDHEDHEDEDEDHEGGDDDD